MLGSGQYGATFHRTYKPQQRMLRNVFVSSLILYQYTGKRCGCWYAFRVASPRQGRMVFALAVYGHRKERTRSWNRMYRRDGIIDRIRCTVCKLDTHFFLISWRFARERTERKYSSIPAACCWQRAKHRPNILLRLIPDCCNNTHLCLK